jgi:pre-mRNA-splicing factor 38A
MANLTDPLIRAVQGTDPQNLMEYITRQKIYDSRFWKEDCFGLTAADVLERAAKTLHNMGGTFGANQQPTKFLCLALKLLQLQPDAELVQEFIQQDHFKYVKALGAFYLRLTGRPAEIYESLEPLYADYSKLKVRGMSEWKLMHMDEFVDELLTQPFACGIALPRLPFRQTLQQEGYLKEEGPRPTALREVLEEAGGLEEYLKYKVELEKSPAAIALWEERRGKKDSKSNEVHKGDERDRNYDDASRPPIEDGEEEDEREDDDCKRRKEDKEDSKRKTRTRGYDEPKEKRKKQKYGSLFKKEKHKDRKVSEDNDKPKKSRPEEGSDEYWNEQRAKLGLKPLTL